MEPYEEPQTRIEFMPLSIVRALWKRSVVIALSWILISAVGAAIIYTLPAVYQARTIILIERQRIPERYVVSTVNEDLSNRLNRISQQILSYEPLLRLIEEFNLYAGDKGRLVQDEIVQKMRSDIRVSLIEGWTQTSAPAFQIVFEGEDPNVVAQVTNRLATLFIDENLRTRANQALGTSEFLTNQLEELRQEVERQESLMSDYRTRNSGELPEQRGVMLAELSRLEREMQGAQDEIQRTHQARMVYESSLTSARGTLEMLQRMADEQSRGASRLFEGGSAVPGTDPAIAEMRRAQDELAQLESRYSSAHPEVVRARAMVERLKQAVQASPAADAKPAQTVTIPEAAEQVGLDPTNLLAGGNLAQSIVRERERVRNIQTQIELAQEQIKTAEARRGMIAARMNQVDARLNRMPMHEQELAKVTRDYGISMDNYQSLLEKRIEADLASEMETRQKAEKFSVLDAARLPEKPVRPDRVLLLAVTVGAGLFASCLIGFGVELKSNVLLGEWELPPNVTLLGQVPFIQIDPETGEPTSGAAGGGRFRISKPLWIASSLVLMLVVAAATSFYFGWMPF